MLSNSDKLVTFIELTNYRRDNLQTGLMSDRITTRSETLDTLVVHSRHVRVR